MSVKQNWTKMTRWHQIGRNIFPDTINRGLRMYPDHYNYCMDIVAPVSMGTWTSIFQCIRPPETSRIYSRRASWSPVPNSPTPCMIGSRVTLGPCSPRCSLYFFNLYGRQNKLNRRREKSWESARFCETETRWTRTEYGISLGMIFNETRIWSQIGCDSSDTEVRPAHARTPGRRVLRGVCEQSVGNRRLGKWRIDLVADLLYIGLPVWAKPNDMIGSIVSDLSNRFFRFM